MVLEIAEGKQNRGDKTKAQSYGLATVVMKEQILSNLEDHHNPEEPREQKTRRKRGETPIKRCGTLIDLAEPDAQVNRPDSNYEIDEYVARRGMRQPDYQALWDRDREEEKQPVHTRRGRIDPAISQGRRDGGSVQQSFSQQLEDSTQFGKVIQLKKMLFWRRRVDRCVLKNPGVLVEEKHGVQSSCQGRVDVALGTIADHPTAVLRQFVPSNHGAIGRRVLFSNDLNRREMPREP